MRLGADETSFRKRHRYVTLVTDQEASRVLHVATGRGTASLEAYFETLSDEEREAVESIAMDMHRPYITATALHVPDAEDKIAFDKFHVIKLFTDGVDRVRRAENKALMADGDRTLVGSKYVWLMNPANMKASKKAHFAELKGLALHVGRACGTKEMAQRLWHYTTRRGAARAWLGICDWLQRSQLAPTIQVGRTIKHNLLGILNAVVHGGTNGAAEGINTKVQELKKRAHGYRNEVNFAAAIYFHLGGLDLYPRPLGAHTNR